MAELEGSSGGGDSTTDSTDSTSSTDDPRRPQNFQGTFTESGNLKITFPAWILKLRQLTLLVDHPTAWILAALLPIGFFEVQARLARGESPAELIVEDFIFGQILVPAGRVPVRAGPTLIGGIQLIAFGTDSRVGFTPGTLPGLLDAPDLLGRLIAAPLVATGETIASQLNTLYASISVDLVGLRRARVREHALGHHVRHRRARHLGPAERHRRARREPHPGGGRADGPGPATYQVVTMTARQLLTDPANWLMGALGAAAAVLGAVAFDPTGTALAVVLTFIGNASTIFTASSITAWTLGPEIEALKPWVPALRKVALAAGIIWVVQLLAGFGDDVEENLRENDK
ncbi:MAG: hypothetical protein U5J98_06975 [Halobacteriales archaeon]|nr:hypothetical protein [Halobacteriales archaeon]